jgi:hypothetical protein
MSHCPLLTVLTLGSEGFPYVPSEIRQLIWYPKEPENTVELYCSICERKFVIGRHHDYNNHFRCLSCVGHPEGHYHQPGVVS